MRQVDVGSVGHRAGSTQAWRRVARGAVAVVGALVVWALIASGGVLPGLSNLAAQVVYACGLGTGPTMMANGDPALLHPLPVGTTGGANQPYGQFSGQFVANTPINFAEDMSRALNAPSNLNIVWNFGDGSATVANNTPTHTFTKPGTYNIQTQLTGADSGNSGPLTWTDFQNDLDSATITVVAQAYSTPPVAVAHASTSIVNRGGSVTFDATGSHSQDGSQVKYLWNFNDGQTSTQAQVTHEFGGFIGNGIVTLTVTDGRGASSVATLTIVVSTASLASNVTSVQAGQTVSFNAAANLGTPVATTGGLTNDYFWNFGEGTSSIKTTTPTTTYTFTKPGQYAIAVQVVAGQAVNAVEAEMVTVTAAAASKPSGVLQFGSLQVKSWELLAVVGLVIAGILLALLSNFQAERKRARAILAAKAQRSAMQARGRGGARMDRSERYDDRGRSTARRRSPREMEYDEREPVRGRGSRRSADDYDDRPNRSSGRSSGGRPSPQGRDDYDRRGDGGGNRRDARPAQSRGRRSDRSRGGDW